MAIIGANVASNVRHRLEASYMSIDQIAERRPSVLFAILQEIRPHQWVKNFLVFVPILTAGLYTDLKVWEAAIITFAAFSMAASGIYIINDLLDIEADRKHPRKRYRPLASGAMPLSAAYILAPLLLLSGAGLALAAGVLPYVIMYAVCSFAYSAKFKEMPLVDVFLLAGLYSVRLYAGGIATGNEVSLWLFAFSCFLFLALAIIKRIAELDDLRRRIGEDETQDEKLARRGYGTNDILILGAFGTSASFVSSMILALYVQSDALMHTGRNPHALWLIVPLMLFWQCRLWLATARGYMTDDPIIYAMKDWVSVLVGIALTVTMVMSFTFA
jgi:4-hydroxybenzoate polyprenyltransferase